MGGKTKKRVGGPEQDHPPASNTPPAPSGAVRRRKGSAPSAPQRFDPLWKALDSQLGGREGLLSVALASSNIKARELVDLLLDKAHQQAGTKVLAYKAGLSASEIVQMFKEKKGLEADMALYEALPIVVRDAAEDAKASMTPCDHCKGTGQYEAVACYVCGGVGKIRRPGDRDKLKFVGEAAGLVGKTSPLIEQNQQIVVNQAAPTSFEDMMRKSTLETSRVRVLDAKKVEDEHPNSQD